MTRPTWDEWGLAIAKAVSLRADCSRRQVGAVIVTPDHRILSTGYNGAPEGMPGCLEGACPRGQSDAAPGSSYDTGAGTCIALHAEQNALLQAERIKIAGSTVYITDEPCTGCWRMLSGSGALRVVYPGASFFRTADGWKKEGRA